VKRIVRAWRQTFSSAANFVQQIIGRNFSQLPPRAEFVCPSLPKPRQAQHLPIAANFFAPFICFAGENRYIENHGNKNSRDENEKAVASRDFSRRQNIKKRLRFGLTIGVSMVCICFILTPIVLLLVISKMPAFLFWYAITTAFVGLLGLIGLFVWLKKSSN
jgi:hypothetical protein